MPHSFSKGARNLKVTLNINTLEVCVMRHHKIVQKFIVGETSSEMPNAKATRSHVIR